MLASRKRKRGVNFLALVPDFLAPNLFLLSSVKMGKPENSTADPSSKTPIGQTDRRTDSPNSVTDSEQLLIMMPYIRLGRS